MESIHLVDVNSSNISVTWPLLLRAISKADFISLDLELSGLGEITGRLMEEHYQGLCSVVASRAILSLGLACFIWNEERSEVTCPKGVPLTVEVFNVWLLCQRPFTTDPSSAQFLVKHGFDFNKLYSLGLPYTPPSERKQTSTSTSSSSSWLTSYSLDSMFACLLHCHAPLVVHNGWLDLLFLYHVCYGPLPSTSASVLADLTEMFPVGVYDTKALANFKFYEDASFLEYLFRNSQRNNSVLHNKEEWHIVLQSNPSHFYEPVDIAPPPSLSLEQILLVEVCPSFAKYGFCHAPKCSKSHDVIIVIEQKKAHLDQVRKSRSKRKRKRKEHDKYKQPRVDDDDDDRSCEDHMTSEADCATSEHPRTDMSTLFAQELSTAKAHFTQTTPITPPITPPTKSRQASFGHRAGFDAFMTGYVFGCYALQSDSTKKGHLEGFGKERNCLIRRFSSNPLHIVKSNFTKTSLTHVKSKERMKEINSKISELLLI